jgi:hypothetical protein
MTLENILKLFVFFLTIAPIEVSLKQKKLFYMFSQSYKTKQYTLAGYQFEVLFRVIKSEKLEEAYLGQKLCYRQCTA